ncbi:hypothetical protein PGT21_016349 [Puccinia graminis f. sp. tritici]|uniref:Uncharacterized protein n=1 Tax=Puccinia graminis f. sp. tritici TaxID=56615 RepID=A0A5B0PQ60_PUCGR|nr:hypothetical protein PGT21_016349 [Puccinia graminis f. sp. tritici]
MKWKQQWCDCNFFEHIFRPTIPSQPNSTGGTILKLHHIQIANNVPRQFAPEKTSTVILIALVITLHSDQVAASTQTCETYFGPGRDPQRYYPGNGTRHHMAWEQSHPSQVTKDSRNQPAQEGDHEDTSSIAHRITRSSGPELLARIETDPNETQSKSGDHK